MEAGVCTRLFDANPEVEVIEQRVLQQKLNSEDFVHLFDIPKHYSAFQSKCNEAKLLNAVCGTCT